MLLEDVLRERPPAVLRARILARLALAYGQAGRIADEIAAYSEALAVEPLADDRARLLANRAEALMHAGNIAGAIAGYREALTVRSAAPTTLWGLAVALDRSGDLERALAAVSLARVYDPADKEINGPDWVYVPPHDKFWYEALGYWSRARSADVEGDRGDAYARAVQAWKAYAANAARDDRWLDLGRLRCISTLEEWSGAIARPTDLGGAPPRKPARTPLNCG
jgi:tetratricopeptide (TPR) repeat protein